VRSESVKRATFLLGLAAVLLGMTFLIYPLSSGDRDCGSAAMPKKETVSLPTYSVPEQCEAPIHRHRWFGGAFLALGTVAALGTGPRCLVTSD